MKFFLKTSIKQIEKFINFLRLRKNNILYNTSLNNFNGLLTVYCAGKFIIEKDVRINSKYSSNPIGGQTFSSFFVKEKGILTIGENSAISNSTIVCWHKITIKKNVFIGGGCKIYDTDFHSVHYLDRNQVVDDKVKVKEVVINDNVFIGTSSIILKGVIIGSNSVIGAGSVVRNDIPANEIWAGNPAVKIKNIPSKSSYA